MRLRLIFPGAAVAIALALLVARVSPADAAVQPSSQQSPVGVWLTPGGDGVIEIHVCPSGFCGRIVGMSQVIGDNGKPPSDPDGVPDCGRDILHLREEIKPGLWTGDILDPDDGTDWRCETWLAGGMLHLRGYVVAPVFGKTQDWTPYRGRVGANCAMM